MNAVAALSPVACVEVLDGHYYIDIYIYHDFITTLWLLWFHNYPLAVVACGFVHHAINDNGSKERTAVISVTE